VVVPVLNFGQQTGYIKVFVIFSAPPSNVGLVTSGRSRLLSFHSFPVHYSTNILSFDDR
jgi:hypothetical protein